MSHWIRVRTVKDSQDRSKNYGVGPGLIALGKWVKIRGKASTFTNKAPAHKRKGKSRGR